MQKAVSIFVKKCVLGLAGSAFCLLAVQSAFSQTAPAPATIAAAGAINFPPSASMKKVDEFLATLRPPTTAKALLAGNDLLLDLPDIVAAGPVRAKVVSTITRTDGMWLLSMHPLPDSGSALFAGLQIDIAALPEATLTLQFYKTQTVLLVVRAGGKYYGTYREVKVGQTNARGVSK